MISVIIPVYGVEKYLDKCVESVINQTYPELEIILVDDGSPDNCPSMCDNWAHRDDRIKVIHKKNGGLSSARNAGLDIADGEYVFFLDSDDYISEDCLERLFRAVLSDKSDVAVCDSVKVSESCEQLKPSAVSDSRCISQEELFSCVGKRGDWLYIVSWGKLFKAELFENIRFPEGKLNEDEFVFYRVFDKCRSVSLCKDAVYFYVQREGSIMSAYTPKRLDAVEAFMLQSEFFCENGFTVAVGAIRCRAYDVAVNVFLNNRLSPFDRLFRQVLSEYKSICSLDKSCTKKELAISVVRMVLAAYPFNTVSGRIIRAKKERMH